VAEGKQMDEAEWLACTNLRAILMRVRKKSDRKLRLLAAACTRRVWHLFPHPSFQEVVVAVERFADGLISQNELLARKESAKEASKAIRRTATRSSQDWSTAGTKTYHAILAITRAKAGQVARTVSGEVAIAVLFAALAQAEARDLGFEERYRAEDAAEDAELRAHCSLARDLFDNPFRPVVFDPAWRTTSVTALAQAAYDNRTLPAGTLESDRLAILADALEEVGCTDPDIMGHLRGPGPHVRGCHVIDQITGRE
jgi:hypothetical protein